MHDPEQDPGYDFLPTGLPTVTNESRAHRIQRLITQAQQHLAQLGTSCAMDSRYPALRWSGGRLELLDQRLLPHEVRYLRLDTATDVAESIRNMAVRGAPAIGIAAAYGAALAARSQPLAGSSVETWQAALQPELELLAQARPTAVNLFWALERARQEIAAGGDDVAARLELLALRMHTEDIEANHQIGRYGAALFTAPVSIYTHCNAGALATGGYGTALGVVRSAQSESKLKHVFTGETRPWMQGSRLTSWELQQENIAVQLTVEAAAGSLMQQGQVDWVVVGADRVAANGDVANKIGTYNLAVLARHHGLKFMVALPTSTIDMEAGSGADIPIEQRAAEEITHFAGAAVAPEGVNAINPAFDITPADLVDALVTEKGVVHQPDLRRISRLVCGQA